MRSIRRALHSGEPLDLLAEVSSLLAVVDPREYGFGRRDGEPPYSLRELVDMFLDVDRVETTALLAVVAELTADDVLAARIRRELAGRDDRLPEWLARLGQAEVYRVREMVHVLGDGDNVNIAVRFAGGAELTAVVYIDHNMGTLVKDAFVVPESLAGLEALMRAKADDPDTVWRDRRPGRRPGPRHRGDRAGGDDRAAVRDRHLAGVPSDRRVAHPTAAGGWDRLPAAGVERSRTGSSWPTGSSPRRSVHHSMIADHRGLLESVIWFGADYGPGDPLRWSPVAVEIILDDWIPRKIVADAAYLSKAPRAAAGVRPLLPRRARHPGGADRRHARRRRRLRTGLSAHDPFAAAAGPDGAAGRDGCHRPRRSVADGRARRRLAVRLRRPRRRSCADCSSRPPEATTRSAPSTTGRLPDEDFDWSGIAGDIHGKVGEVLELTDACCDELLDVEYRTACRRLLARAAAGDAAVFRRRASSASAAAAICWIVGKDNDLFSHWGGGMLVKDLIAHFGLKQGSVSQRAETLMKAAGFDRSTPTWDLRLGDPQLLVSRRRRRMIELRDEYYSED